MYVRNIAYTFSNKSGEVVLRWAPPENPNEEILYTVYQSPSPLNGIRDFFNNDVAKILNVSHPYTDVTLKPKRVGSFYFGVTVKRENYEGFDLLDKESYILVDAIRDSEKEIRSLSYKIDYKNARINLEWLPPKNPDETVTYKVYESKKPFDEEERSFEIGVNNVGSLKHPKKQISLNLPLEKGIYYYGVTVSRFDKEYLDLHKNRSYIGMNVEKLLRKIPLANFEKNKQDTLKQRRYSRDSFQNSRNRRQKRSFYSGGVSRRQNDYNPQVKELVDTTFKAKDSKKTPELFVKKPKYKPKMTEKELINKPSKVWKKTNSKELINKSSKTWKKTNSKELINKPSKIWKKTNSKELVNKYPKVWKKTQSKELVNKSPKVWKKTQSKELVNKSPKVWKKTQSKELVNKPPKVWKKTQSKELLAVQKKVLYPKSLNSEELPKKYEQKNSDSGKELISKDKYQQKSYPRENESELLKIPTFQKNKINSSDASLLRSPYKYLPNKTGYRIKYREKEKKQSYRQIQPIYRKKTILKQRIPKKRISTNRKRTIFSKKVDQKIDIIIRELFLEKKYKKAIRLFKNFDNQNLDNLTRGKLNFYLGLCYYEVNNYQTALNYLISPEARLYNKDRALFWEKRSLAKLSD